MRGPPRNPPSSASKSLVWLAAGWKSWRGNSAYPPPNRTHPVSHAVTQLSGGASAKRGSRRDRGLLTCSAESSWPSSGGGGAHSLPRELRSAADDRSNRLQFGLPPHSFILELCATTTYRRCKRRGGREEIAGSLIEGKGGWGEIPASEGGRAHSSEPGGKRREAPVSFQKVH